MGDRTRIEWTDATWNPIRGCSRVSEGCRHCYAERMAARFSGPGQPYGGLVRSTDHGPRWTGQVRLAEDVLDAPLHWRRPRRIFVNSMSDLFHPAVPDEWIDRIFAIMALCPQHIFQVLTKRPERMLRWFSTDPAPSLSRIGAIQNHVDTYYARITPADRFGKAGRTIVAYNWPLPNVWLGVSVENQAAADERIPYLLQTPAAVRFVSCEPLLGPIRLERDWLRCPGGAEYGHGMSLTTVHAGGCCKRHPKIDWIIVGGESGPGARPMHPDWVRSIRDQCQAAGVAFFFKQWGEYCYPSQMSSDTWQQVDMAINLGHHSDSPIRVGKRLAGALLDGREWREWPDERRSG